MKHRKATIVAALFAALAAVFVVVDSLPTKAQRELHALRDVLRREGYKFAEADIAVPGFTKRESAIANKLFRLEKQPELDWSYESRSMIGVWGGTAHSGWRPDAAWADRIRDLPRLESHFGFIAEARSFVLENRLIRFAHQPDMRHKLRFPKADWIALTELSYTGSARTLAELLAGRPEEAWTNLLFVNRIAANYRPNPVRSEYFVRYSLLNIAFSTTWEAIQSHQWSDAQLAALQKTWNGADLLSGVGDLPAAICAGVMDYIEAGPPGLFAEIKSFKDLKEMSWTRLEELYRPYRADRDYLREHAAADLMAFMRFSVWQTDRLRQALRSASWLEMQGITNLPGKADDFVFSRGGDSRFGQKIFPMHTMESINLAAMEPLELDEGVLAMVEAESRRRVLLAALAVERAKLRLGRLPATLAEAGTILPDYMDGEPLRYRPAPDGTYFIYSIGMDLKDGGGQSDQSTLFRDYSGGDIVWPRCATDDPSPKSDISR